MKGKRRTVNFDGKRRPRWLSGDGVWGGHNILPYMTLGPFREISGNSQNKKMRQSMGTLLLFPLVEYYGSGTMWSLLQLVFHIYNIKPTCSQNNPAKSLLWVRLHQFQYLAVAQPNSMNWHQLCSTCTWHCGSWHDILLPHTDFNTEGLVGCVIFHTHICVYISTYLALNRISLPLRHEPVLFDWRKPVTTSGSVRSNKKTIYSLKRIRNVQSSSCSICANFNKDFVYTKWEG